MKGKRPDTLKSVLLKLPSLGIAGKVREARIMALWPRCVGRNVARHSSPVRLIDKTLHCAVSSAPWMSELNYQKRSIIEKINSAVGEGAVEDIVFKAGTVTPPPETAEPEPKKAKRLSPEKQRLVEETVKDIDDPELRAAVRRAMATAEAED